MANMAIVKGNPYILLEESESINDDNNNALSGSEFLESFYRSIMFLVKSVEVSN